MKKILLVFLLTFSNFYSQTNDSNINIDSQSSDWFKDDFQHSLFTFSISDNEGGFISGRNYSQGFIIEHFDENMKLIKTLDLESKEKDHFILDSYVFEENIYLIENIQNKDGYKSEYNVIKIAPELKVLEKTFLFSVPFKDIQFNYYTSGLINDIDNNKKGYLTLSKNLFAISYNTSTEHRESHKIKLFDKKTLSEKFEYNLDLDFDKSKTNLEQLIIDDENEVLYAIISYFLNDKKMDIGIKQIQAGETFVYRISKEDLKSYKIKSEYLFASPKLKIVNDKIILFSFFAHEDVAYKGYLGLSFHELDKNYLTLQKENYNDFTPDFIIQKYGKVKEHPLINSVITSIYSTENGYIVDAETNDLSISGQKTGNSYSFHDLLIASLDKNGKLNWFRNINKIQSSNYKAEYRFFGYTSFFRDKNLYLIINADEELKDYDDGRRVMFMSKKIDKMIPFVIKINSDGEWNYKCINTLNLDKHPLLIRNGQYFDNNILFITDLDKEKKMVKLSF